MATTARPSKKANENFHNELFRRSKTTIIVNITLTLLLWVSFFGCSFFGYLFCLREVIYLKYFVSSLIIQLGIILLIQKNIWSDALTASQKSYFRDYYVQAPHLSKTGGQIDEMITSDEDSINFVEKIRLERPNEGCVIINTRVLRGFCNNREDMKLCARACKTVILVDCDLNTFHGGELLRIGDLKFKVENNNLLQKEFIRNLKAVYGTRVSYLLDYLQSAGLQWFIQVKPLKIGVITKSNTLTKELNNKQA